MFTINFVGANSANTAIEAIRQIVSQAAANTPSELASLVATSPDGLAWTLALTFAPILT